MNEMADLKLFFLPFQQLLYMFVEKFDNTAVTYGYKLFLNCITPKYWQISFEC
jgi:hypothetical protein